MPDAKCRIPALRDLAEDPWTHHMRRGEFARAWEISDRWLRERAGTDCWHLPRHFQYIWDGRPVEGRRVLVRCYHGLGDTIQFVRYAPLLKARGCEVLMWAQPSLLPLLAHAVGIDRLLPLHDGDPGIDYDVDVELMELPHLFRTTIDTLPASAPYLHVEPLPLPATTPRGRDHLQNRAPGVSRAAPDRANYPDPDLKVGLVWRAGDWAEHRSIPFAELAPLTSRGVAWYVLQGHPGLNERPDDFGIVVGASDVLEAARAIRSLDLIITIDSMAAHLAGALAKPVWTLLAKEADWRWMIDRDDSPWYPTMRLFRQERTDDWRPVIARVAGELDAVVASGRIEATRE
jgi:hypothetical protein